MSADTSPFGPILGADAAVLPWAIREQYLLSPDTPYAVRLDGRMDRVWRRHAWLWPCFWLLAQVDLLFPETGRDVPALMVVAAGRDRCGQPYQTWRRTFHFRKPRRFNATMFYDRRLNRVVERFGLGGVLQVAWEVRFEAPGTVEIVTAGCLLRLGRWRLPLPRPLCMMVRAVERADPAHDDTIHIDLVISHPLLGALFGYAGTFRCSTILPAEVHDADRSLPNGR